MCKIFVRARASVRAYACVCKRKIAKKSSCYRRPRLPEIGVISLQQITLTVKNGGYFTHKGIGAMVMKGTIKWTDMVLYTRRIMHRVMRTYIVLKKLSDRSKRERKLNNSVRSVR